MAILSLTACADKDNTEKKNYYGKWEVEAIIYPESTIKEVINNGSYVLIDDISWTDFFIDSPAHRSEGEWKGKTLIIPDSDYKFEVIYEEPNKVIHMKTPMGTFVLNKL